LDKIQKYKRAKYVKELEKFTNRVVKFLGDEKKEKEEFKTYIDKIFASLEDIEKVLLKNEYLKSLERFVEKTANLPQSQKSIEEIRKETLYEANALRKLKRVKKYNRNQK